MRICVFGAGGVGGFLAARLAHAGRDVAVVARGAHLDAIRADGLTLELPDERFTVRVDASDDPAAIGPCDLVLVTTKTTANTAVARAIAPLLGAETPVVFTQNGIHWWYGHGFAPGGRAIDLPRLDPEGVIAKHVGAERAIGLIVYSPNEVRAPGVVSNPGHPNRFVLGDVSGPGPREDRVAEALSGAGFALGRTDDIRREMWRKLAVNLSGGPLGAITGGRTDQLVGHEPTRLLGRRMMEELMAIAAAQGFPDLGIDIDAVTAPGARGRHKPSMLQDLERGRPMEIDGMLAAPVDLARAAGVATPCIDTVLAILSLRARIAGCYGEKLD